MQGKSHASVGASGYAISAATVAALSANPAAATATTVAAALVAGAGVALSFIPKSAFSGLAGTGANFASASARAFGWVLFALASAVLVGVGVYALAPEITPVGTAVPVIIWALVTAGWALFPDIDEPGSTVSRMLGPVSQAFSKFVRTVSGGHREMTHTWVFMAITFAFGLLAAYVGGALAAITVGLSVYLSWGVIGPKSLRKYSLLVGLVSGALIYWKIPDLSPVVFAITYGTWLHILGDMATKSGVKFAWPSNRAMGWRAFATVSLARKRYEAKKKGKPGPSPKDYFNAYSERTVVAVYCLFGIIAAAIAIAPSDVTIAESSTAASILSALSAVL